ncbi:hypothetical protein EYF80_052532 [Liparis tanakae]|uniref:Uncharacterized protein n=1 Tax=Liparis tanakae TaxID=230148 RepID=A0A4Z2FAC6_9TELE|nr:hypothetical protein EYF80_052532 [Liparis tanakae]
MDIPPLLFFSHEPNTLFHCFLTRIRRERTGAICQCPVTGRELAVERFQCFQGRRVGRSLLAVSVGPDLHPAAPPLICWSRGVSRPPAGRSVAVVLSF